MTNLFTTLELRAILKRYLKSERVLIIQINGSEPFFVKVNRLGWFTVTLDVLDTDEETWLATEIIPIRDILCINESSVERCRMQLIYQHGDAEDIEAMEAGFMVGNYDEDDEDDCE